MRIVNVSCSIRRKSVPGYSHSICSHCFFVLLIMLLSVHQLFGQTNPAYTIYRNTYSVTNPASTALFYKHYASFCGFKRGSTSYDLTMGSLLYEYKLDKISSGLGVILGHYNYFDIILKNSFAINYAYHLDLGEEGCFSAGVSLGNIHSHINIESLIFEDQLPDGSISAFPSMKSDESKLFANFGFIYSFKNLLVGISVAERYLQPIKEGSYFREDQWAINMTASYDFNINNNLIITPRIFALRYAERDDRIDYSLLINLHKRYWAGFTYSDESTLALQLGLDINGRYRIGYARKIHTDPSAAYFLNTHEIAAAVMIK